MPTYPNVLAGQRITAGLLNSMLPLTVVKPSDESLTANTTLQNDNDLVIAGLAAGAVYDFECYLDYEGGAQGTSDIKWSWNVPASSTLRYQCSRVDTSGNVSVGVTQRGGDTVIARTNGTGNLLAVLMAGSLVMASSAGTLQLQWAQNSSSAAATIVHAQSRLRLIRTS